MTEKRIIGAVAANGDNIDVVDYVIFDLNILSELHLEVDAVSGTTPDAAVNACHRDVVHLTASKLSDFGNAMQEHGQIKRIMDQAVGRQINIGLKSGYIDGAKMKQAMLTKLQDLRYAATR